MSISWIKLIGSFPGVKKAIDGLVAPGASSSKSVWYQVLKSAVTVSTACGLMFVLSEEEVETISTALAVAVPTIATLLDAAASIWLRIHTHESLGVKAERAVRDEQQK